MSRVTKWGLAGVVLLIAGGGLWFYWRHEARYPSTADAYVHANVVEMAAQISGKVESIYVRNNQPVSAGDPLIQIDPAPFRIALDEAEAKYATALQEVGASGSAVAAAAAQVDAQQAAVDQAQQEADRTLPLVKQGLLPPSQADAVRDALVAARARLASARANLEQAQRRLGETGAKNPQIRAAAAAVAQARLDLAHTRITAPAAGIVADFTVRPGSVVEANRALFALVESREWWVDANYEETTLRRLHPGQPATIKVDIYPHHPFRGVVRSISPASGAAFSLMPPENATGNWVKVTQRFPVRITILNPDPAYPLRVGASAEVTVDTVAPREPTDG